MNLNQSAHGDREAGFIHTRMRLAPQGRGRPLVGPGSAGPHRRLDARGARLARLAGRAVLPLRRQHAPGRGDRGRQGRGGNEVRLLHQRLRRRRPRQVGSTPSRTPRRRRWRRNTRRSTTSRPRLRRGGERHESLLYGARLELGLRAFLGKGGFKGFTTTFEDLHGLKQLPGLAPQRLMADGYGFGARGRLEDRGARARDEGHGRGPAGRHLVHGGLHLPPAARTAIWCSARTCSRSARRSRRASPRSRSIPLVDRRQGGSGPPRVRRARRAGAQRHPHRPRRALPPARQRGDRGQASGPAETAGRARGLGVQARLQDGLRGLDSCRRRPPHRLQLRRDRRDARGLRDHRGHRVRPDRRRRREIPAFKQDLRNNDVYYHLAQGFRA